MAVTIFLQEFNGVAPGSATAKTGGEAGLRFKSADDSTLDISDPLVRPNAGVYRSYEKYLQAYLQSLGGATSISNVELFTTSSPIDGVAISAEQRGAYVDPLAGGYDAGGAMIGAPVDFFTKTSDDPFILGAGPFEVGDEASAIGDFVALQMEVYPNAAITTTADVNIVLRYDETA